MHTNFDPRKWNIIAGVALLTAGCGSRQAGFGANEAGDAGPEGGDVGIETGDGGSEAGDAGSETGPECETSSDCPASYACYYGICEYYSTHDGGWGYYYECYSDEECRFGVCVANYCEEASPSLDECQDVEMETMIPVGVDNEILALQFADVDDDGHDEVVLATATDLHVYKDTMQPMTITPRGAWAGELKDLTTGDFDGLPGDDLIVLIEGDLVLHASLGDGTFAPGVATPVSLMGSKGLLAGDFDGQSPTDLLVWGSDGAVVERGFDSLALSDQPVDAVAAFAFGAAVPRFALRHANELDLFSLDGQLSNHAQGLGLGPLTLVAFTTELGPHYATIRPHPGWSEIELRDATGEPTWPEWNVYAGVPEQLRAGDLNGDGADEIVILGVGDEVDIYYTPTGAGECSFPTLITLGEFEILAALGDRDADGDDELALRTLANESVLFDGG